MRKLTTSAIAIAALMGSLVIVDTLEAARPRNPVERRLRPGRGFWEDSTPSRSYSSNRTFLRSTPSYSSPTYAVPRNYMPAAPVVRTAPVPSPNVVQQSYVMPSAPMVNCPPVYSSPAYQPGIIAERANDASPGTVGTGSAQSVEGVARDPQSSAAPEKR